MLKRYCISQGRVVDATDEPSPILVYVNPDPAERQHLIEECKIDEHTLQSSLDPDELARVEFEPEYTALIVKRPRRYSAVDNFLFKVQSLGIFLFRDRLIILLGEEVQLFDRRQFSRLVTIQDVVLKLVFMSTWHFEEHLKVISACSDELEREIQTSVNNRQLLSMFTLEKSLVFYLEAISSNSRVINKLRANAAKFGFTEEQREFVEDVAIENSQCFEMAQIYSQVLSGLMDARASVISNNLNMMMKNLNAFVIAVAVPSFFAGVGGMSEFSNMIGFEKHWKWAYPLFVVGMILIGMVTFFLIKKAERYWKES